MIPKDKRADMATQCCILCKDLERDPDPSYTRLAFDFTPRQLIASVESTRCLQCVTLLESIRVFEDSFGSFIVDVRRVHAYGLFDADPNATLYLELYFCDERPKLALEVFYSENPVKTPGLQNGKAPEVVDGRSFLMSAIKPRRLMASDFSSSLQWIRSLINSCIHDHKSCVQAEVIPFPRRVVAFERGPDKAITVKLEEDVCQPQGRYATLSHCWGSHQTLVTTTATINTRRRGIEWKDIPRTYQDSIEVCLQLGIGYLWIDSLCILQDDRQDWEIESAKMADIYENSYITIAATKAEDDVAGLFSNTRSSFTTRPLPRQPNGTASSTVYIRQTIPHDIGQGHIISDRAPLLSRGWVFQERLLAPRVLHFCGMELVWECRQSTVCECGTLESCDGWKQRFSSNEDGPSCKPDVSDNYVDRVSTNTQEILLDYVGLLIRNATDLAEKDARSSGKLQRILDRFQRKSRRRASSDSPQVPRSLQPPKIDEAFGGDLGRQVYNDGWHRVVEQFSRLKLTRQSDCLPALSGLAHRCGYASADYLAGLWASTLGYDVLWRVDKLETVSIRPTTYLGPSWSWISVAAPVDYWGESELKERLEVHARLKATYHRQLLADVESLEMNIRDRLLAEKKIFTVDIRGSSSPFGPLPFGGSPFGTEYIEGLGVIERAYRQRMAQLGSFKKVSWAGSVMLKGQNPFGEVTSGKLLARGKLNTA
ncbi:heterokaryon incompatibility protein-domain-containing protein, partial [Apiospora marii]